MQSLYMHDSSCHSEAEGCKRWADPLDPFFLVKFESKMPLGIVFTPCGCTWLLMLVSLFEFLHLCCCEVCTVRTHSVVLQYSQL